MAAAVSLHIRPSSACVSPLASRRRRMLSLNCTHSPPFNVC
nr:MAG TPA: hypothetical protein [Caudoviricetes sp.]DAK97738.1 MAG TPA: hypothetical protein [Caudoviricetes sp.]DAV30028.1 MAG TPA: hypothetical protein [Caudoviricetes sp.]